MWRLCVRAYVRVPMYARLCTRAYVRVLNANRSQEPGTDITVLMNLLNNLIDMLLEHKISQLLAGNHTHANTRMQTRTRNHAHANTRALTADMHK